MRVVVSKIVRFLRGVVIDPVEAALYIPEHFSKRYEYHPRYEADRDWETRFHSWFGTPWPCPECTTLYPLWQTIGAELEAQGLGFGRATYGEYSDAELSMARAVWCTVLHQRPSTVLETGVARGVTSRIILEAMIRNDQGHLYSIDLPHPFQKELHAQTGVVVPASHRPRWAYIKGSSRRRLPSLLPSLGRLDLFIHDSLHTARNTRFEMEQVLPAIRSGGVMIIDDIGTHNAFADFASKHPALETLVCPHSDREGSYFGLVHTR
jgi:hypothetical protein